MVVMGIELIIVGLIAATIIVFLAIDSALSKRRARKRQEALEYLLRMTDKVYFYGRPVADCLKNGAVSELFWDQVGDFSKIFSGLVLYALYAHGDESARMHWKHWTRREDLLIEHYSTLITFRYAGKQWGLRVRGRHLDEINFSQMNTQPHGYTTWSYLDDIPRRDRYLIENCTDRNRSNLPPDLYYAKTASKEEFDELVEKTLEHIRLKRPL